MNENYKLIQKFLDIIKELAISNPGNRIDKNFIYTSLIGYNISDEQEPYSSTTSILENIEREYQDNNNLDTIKQKNFLIFNYGEIKGNEIKLYIPLDKNHMEQSAKELINFLMSNNIENQIKFANMVRNDNVVIRLNTIKDAKKIIKFVHNNIKEGLLKTNPFLPNIHGIGVTIDNNYSYNLIISEIISNYIMFLKEEDKLYSLSIDGLNSFIKEQSQAIDDLDLKEIYNLLEKITSKQFKLKDIVMHTKRKTVDKPESNIDDNKCYFEKAVKATYRKHPNNIETAILCYIEKGVANYFTNEDNVRLGLIKHVKPSDVLNIMRSKLKEDNVPVPIDNNELINSYLVQILPKENKEEVSQDETLDNISEVLKNAYVNTCKKYGKYQADRALKEFIIHNEVKHFTNDDGYRDELSHKLEGKSPKKIVLLGIDLNGLDSNNIDEVVNRYGESLSCFIDETRKSIE